MGESRRKKPRKYKCKRRALKPSGLGGPRGGASYRPRPPPTAPRRTYNYRTEQKPAPKEEKSHWNGKVEVWTEPQKPRQEKIIKYEVDTDKLLNDLARENKETLNEIAERLREANAEPNPEQSDADNLQKLDSPEKTDETEPTDEATETDEEDELETEEAEPESNGQQEASHEMEIEAEDKLDDPVFTDPAFWARLESELSEELEELEPEEDIELPPEGECY